MFIELESGSHFNGTLHSEITELESLLKHLLDNIFSSPEPKAHKVSLQDRTRAGVRVSVCPLTVSNMNISKTRQPIAIKFNLKHHWGMGKACIRVWARSDQNSGFHGNR